MVSKKSHSSSGDSHEKKTDDENLVMLKNQFGDRFYDNNFTDSNQVYYNQSKKVN